MRRSPSPRTPLPLDEHARLYLPGPERALPAVSAAALSERVLRRQWDKAVRADEGSVAGVRVLV